MSTVRDPVCLVLWTIFLRLFSPIQLGVQDWKDRIAIRSRDVANNTAEDNASSEATDHLSRYLCYVCHTDLTSNSARPVPPLYPSIENLGEITTPVWTSSLIPSLTGIVTPRIGGEPSSVLAPMSEAAMRNVVKDYLLDD